MLRKLMSLISEQTQVDSMYDELVTQQEMTQILTSSEKKPLNETATLKREVISTMPSRFKCEGCGGGFRHTHYTAQMLYREFQVHRI